MWSPRRTACWSPFRDHRCVITVRYLLAAQDHHVHHRDGEDADRPQGIAEPVARVVGGCAEHGGTVNGRTWGNDRGGHVSTVRNQAFGLRRAEDVILPPPVPLRADPRPLPRPQGHPRDVPARSYGSP
ncbi:hypothetical protein SBRY_30356 [Actinacidiphila bryophytorum]|uniref:Uncharacterized protein n=1 Tax=Actinacidiphila bryophytorum TaxID=1436133 RepID=A0A9W4H0W2_9ACTN|nr:hypothetical protein SBRY_30356 [Actinacidiphila bryophytorum]